MGTGLVQGDGVLLRKTAEHPGSQVVVRMGFLPDAELDPGEIVPAQQIDDALEPVVASGAALAADSQPPGVEGDVVNEHQQPLHRDLVVFQRIPHALTGQVHIGRGLEQQHPVPAEGGGAGEALELDPLELAAQRTGQGVHRPEAGVVPGVLILLAGVTQADDQVLRRAAGRWCLFEKHGSNGPFLRISDGTPQGRDRHFPTPPAAAVFRVFVRSQLKSGETGWSS